jgi:signal transduction histidine kinase
MTIPLQLVTERMLLAALREQDLATAAQAARERAQFLAEASLRFGASLDQERTYAAMAGVTLPGHDIWCVVDVLVQGDAVRRLNVVHVERDDAMITRALAEIWSPANEDPFGMAAARRARSVLSLGNVSAATVAARTERTRRILNELGIGGLLVVPIVMRGELLGAITFVSRVDALPFSADDNELAEALAMRCAQALESASLHAAVRAALADAEVARRDAEDAKIAAESARGEAEMANETKGRFLRTMSHELRTPLNAIGGYAQLMELGIRGPVTPEQRSDLASIHRSQAHLLGLVDAVLDYAQIGAGRIAYTSADVSLVDLVAGIVDFVSPQLAAKSIRFASDVGTCGMSVRADAGKVRQILLNLIGNAIKFTPVGGEIAMACIEGEGVDPSHDGQAPMHAVRVTDSGIGIASDKIAAIFDPFVQVISRGLVSPDTGVGLGLAISRELARGMGGDLTVESNIGTGSAFLLTLPAA